MDTKKYLSLLINTQIGINENLGFDKQDTKLRKELFHQQLIKEQKKDERDNFTTINEFLNHCRIAHSKIKNYVFSVTETETEDLEKIKYSVVLKYSLINFIPCPSDILPTEIDNFETDDYLVSMNDFINKQYAFISNNDVNFIGDCLESLRFEEPEQTEPEPFDLSDTSAVEKILYLNELGIIDFLRTKPEFIASTNLMATVLSAITDIKAKTLQPSLSRLTSNDTADKNHPYRTQKTVEKVRQTLIEKNIKLKAS